MGCEANLPCNSCIIQPLERDPVPINKRVFKNLAKGFPDFPLTPINTLPAVVETIQDMPPTTGEDPKVSQSKEGFAVIFAERKMKEMIINGEFTLSPNSGEML